MCGTRALVLGRPVYFLLQRSEIKEIKYERGLRKYLSVFMHILCIYFLEFQNILNFRILPYQESNCPFMNPGCSFKLRLSFSIENALVSLPQENSGWRMQMQMQIRVTLAFKIDTMPQSDLLYIPVDKLLRRIYKLPAAQTFIKKA